MLIIKNISFSYNKKVKILDNISLHLENGVHSLIGLNGTGKTTLLNLIVGLLSASKGEIHYKKKKEVMKFTSYIPYENFFFSHITGREYLSMFKGNTINAHHWCDKLKIPLDLFISEYSSGMRKKIVIIAGMKKEKDIYIFDEPFNGLDLESRYLVSKLMEELKQQNKIIIITSHIIDILNDFSDFFYLLSDSKHLIKYTQEEFDTFEEKLMQIVKKQNH